MRTIEDFGQTRQAQRHLAVANLCKSTLRDFSKLADPTRLQPILDHLRREVLKPGPDKASGPLAALHRQILAVDGTFLKAASSVAWAIRRSGSRTGARLDFHVGVETRLPELLVIPEDREDEAKTARGTITAGAVHLCDRGIFSFDLIAAHAPKSADFVMRTREPGPRCPKLETVETREPTPEARGAGAASDRLVRLVGSDHRKAPDIVPREVVITPRGRPRASGLPADDAARPRRVDHRNFVPVPLADRAVFPLAEVVRAVRPPDQPQPRGCAAELLRGRDRRDVDVSSHGPSSQQISVPHDGDGGERIGDAGGDPADPPGTGTTARDAA